MRQEMCVGSFRALLAMKARAGSPTEKEPAR
jgi:hypothetical protein